MEAKFLGVPMFVWGGLCLVVAIVFTIIWPSNKVANDTTALRYIVLRWFHALVWVLLALSCFVRGAGIFGGDGPANLVALAALPVYLIFMAALLSS
jgi:hypothetical protein